MPVKFRQEFVSTLTLVAHAGFAPLPPVVSKPPVSVPAGRFVQEDAPR